MNTQGNSATVRQRRPQDDQNIISSREDIQPTSRSAGWTLLGQLIITLFTFPLVYIIYVWFFVTDEFITNPHSLDTAPPLVGPLSMNNALEKAERLFEGQIQGPESIVYDKGHIYAGTADGKIIHIEKGVLTTIANFGKLPCGGFENEESCGRPLGMRLDSAGYLIVLDAYLGLFKLNVATGDYIKYFSNDIEIDGAKPKFLNDLDIAEDGTIYFTDSSTRWPRKLHVYTIMEADNTGRLIKYDPKSNKTEVLAKGLMFPNGVQISASQEYLLYSEMVAARIWKYYIKGPKKGNHEIFIENLPGFPDNIRRSKLDGGYWVALPVCRSNGAFSALDLLYPYPLLRKFLMKAIIPQVLTAVGAVHCGRVVQINQQGQITKSLHDISGNSVYIISEVEHGEDGVIYLGSFKAPFLGKLKLEKL